MVIAPGSRSGQLLLFLALLFGIATMHTMGHPSSSHGMPSAAVALGTAEAGGPSHHGGARDTAATGPGAGALATTDRPEPAANRPVPAERAAAVAAERTAPVLPGAGHPDRALGVTPPPADATTATGAAHVRAAAHPPPATAAAPTAPTAPAAPVTGMAPEGLARPVPGSPGGHPAARGGGFAGTESTASTGSAARPGQAAGTGHTEQTVQTGQTTEPRPGQGAATAVLGPSGPQHDAMDPTMVCLAVLGAWGVALLVVAAAWFGRWAGPARVLTGTRREIPWSGAPPPRILLARLSVLRI
ncbi:hypothetical protein ACIBCM_01735 [Streptomyces sp. NPDC051018]|uniref:hypothetical protein n=1 Tax=Streptomyces sp. NPDC051018 TaxID=3365639 RepID=UPI0037B3179F